MRALTRRQRQILKLAVRHEHATGESCSITELSRRLAITPVAVRHHAEALYEKGRVRSPGSPVIPVCPARSEEADSAPVK